jgi:hypothetical protein
MVRLSRSKNLFKNKIRIVSSLVGAERCPLYLNWKRDTALMTIEVIPSHYMHKKGITVCSVYYLQAVGFCRIICSWRP